MLVFIGGILLGKYFFTPEIPEPLAEQEFAEDTLIVQTPGSITTEYNTPAYVSNKLPVIKQTKEADFKPEKRRYYVHAKDTLVRPVRNDYPRTKKMEAGEVIELNSADTTELKKIPGIGSGYARRIVNYRNILGGFYRMEQLQEVYGMHEELYEMIIPFIKIETDKINKISINTLSLDQLRAHPYINFYQAKIIIDIRKRNGRLRNIDELKLLEEFTEEDLLRLAPYLFF
ncbi:MAG: helix-hairpin-helix domain-containing protein [Bacteroidales bacterium]|nr:helix-hairpin-helix domain-containing protein [Bacteroidales bacterium]